LPEICEGEEPHRAVGCCAQAWSVAEVLRMAIELGV
jgi:glycogen debranching enzyme